MAGRQRHAPVLGTQFSISPIAPNPPLLGNGANENLAVRSQSMLLQPGNNVQFDRTMFAKDPSALAPSLSPYQHPQALIELVDSATGLELAVLEVYGYPFNGFHLA